MARLVVRKLSEATEAQEAAGAADAGERYPDGFIAIPRPGIDLDAAIAENRLQRINPWQHGP